MEDLNKSIDTLINDLFSDSVSKAGENFEVANAAKTTADAAIASAPKMQDDAARGAGRPKQISDVPNNDEDGKRGGAYDASISNDQAADEPEETKKQIKAIDQVSTQGHMGQKAQMKDPRLTKAISEEEYAEFQSFKKAQAEQADLRKAEDMKKSEDLRKAELQNLVKSAITEAIQPLQRENQELKKSLGQSEVLIKAMAGQPRQSKSVTGIEALEKSASDFDGPQSFSKAEMQDAAERLVMKKSIPMDAAIELSSTGTIYNPQYRSLVEAELQKQNK